MRWELSSGQHPRPAPALKSDDLASGATALRLAALMLASAPQIDAEIVGITSDIEHYGVQCLRTWQYAAGIVHDANRHHNLQPPLRFSVDAQTSASWQAAPAPFAGDRDGGTFGRSMLDATLDIVDEAVLMDYGGKSSRYC